MPPGFAGLQLVATPRPVAASAAPSHLRVLLLGIAQTTPQADEAVAGTAVQCTGRTQMPHCRRRLWQRMGCSALQCALVIEWIRSYAPGRAAAVQNPRRLVAPTSQTKACTTVGKLSEGRMERRGYTTLMCRHQLSSGWRQHWS